jgi:hypothetical protein
MSTRAYLAVHLKHRSGFVYFQNPMIVSFWLAFICLQGTSRTSLSVEDRINELADALGMPSGDLASAIAVAVREFVPPASLSSISAAAKETGGTHLVDQLLGEQKNEAAAAAQATDAAAGVGSILDRVVGMDEPPSEEA